MHKLTIAATGLMLFAGALRAQQLVVPDGQVFFDSGISALTWRTTLFHFQMIYDNSTFLANGVTGPITINRLRFRAKDAEANLGGQIYSGVSVRLSDAPTSTALALSASTSAVASTTTVIQTTGLIASQFASGASDVQRCFSLTFTSGANVGQTRVVSANTATSITVSLAFPSVPAVGDTFDVTRAPITYNNMAQNFAANVGANVGLPETFASVPVAPASGTVPNDYIIDLPLGVSAFTYDPTTMGNLVIDVNAPSAPAPNATSLINFGTSSVAATSKARRSSTATAGATFGALSDFASIVLMDFTGVGGSSTASIPATVVSYGAGCNAQSANVNQYFGNEDFDLRGPGKSLLFTPDSLVAPTSYAVTAGTNAVDLNQALGAVNSGDDALTTETPPWLAPFAFPGGTTTQLLACTNGFVWLGTTTAATANPSVANWLGGGATGYPARFAPCWHDFIGTRNSVTNPGSGMYVFTDTIGGPGNAITYVTWKDTGEFASVSATGGHSVNSFQCVFFEATGQVEFRFGAMALRGGNAITGFTQGTLGAGINCTDSGSRDLSAELPHASAGPNGAQGALTLTTSARPIVNTSTTFTASNIPAGDVIGLYLYDFVPLSPGVQFPPLVAPGCILSLAFSPNWGFVLDLPTGPTSTSPSFPGPLGAPVYPGGSPFVGAHFYVQYASAVGVGGPFHTSNALDLKLGYN